MNWFSPRPLVLPSPFWVRMALAWMGIFVVFANAHAALTWDRTSTELRARVDQSSVEVTFPFSNTGTEPVTIAHAQASCGCVVPALPKKTFAPGEKGEMRAVFDTTGLTGTQEKSIQVFFADSAKPVTLTLRVAIPAPVEASSRLVWWTVGDAPAAKEIVLTVQPGVKLKSTVATDNNAVEVRLTPAADPLQYRLSLSPRGTGEVAQTAIRLTAELPDRSERPFVVWAQIRR